MCLFPGGRNQNSAFMRVFLAVAYGGTAAFCTTALARGADRPADYLFFSLAMRSGCGVPKQGSVV